MTEPTTDAELEAQEFTEFINNVWKAIYPNGELGEWDYPAQVLRHLEDVLSKLRAETVGLNHQLEMVTTELDRALLTLGGMLGLDVIPPKPETPHTNSFR